MRQEEEAQFLISNNAPLDFPFIVPFLIIHGPLCSLIPAVTYFIFRDVMSLSSCHGLMFHLFPISCLILGLIFQLVRYEDDAIDLWRLTTL